MSVPYSEIYEIFHTQFKATTVISEALQKAYFNNAVAEYELELTELSLNDITEEIETNLSNGEKLLLGKLMYKSYLHQSRQEVNLKLNIYGKDIKVTGLDETKRMLENTYKMTVYEINGMYNKIKDNTYLD